MNKAEAIFFQVLSDLKEYLGNLTLVGGWVPYIYAKYLWTNIEIMPLATSDIDLGVNREIRIIIPSKTIYEKLSPKYGEHHISMDRLFPVVFHLKNVEIHFISAQDIPEKIIAGLIGRQINVNRVEYFEVLLNNSLTVDIPDNKSYKYKLSVPSPSAFIYHKGLTFVDRQDEQSQAKDLHYIYYLLRFCPHFDKMLSQLEEFKKDKNFITFVANINKYFERISSPGCLMVEKENGPDSYISDVRKDVFERFNLKKR